MFSGVQKSASAAGKAKDLRMANDLTWVAAAVVVSSYLTQP